MQVLKEKVLATFGQGWVMRGRYVEINTAQTGRVRRVEMKLERWDYPGQPPDPLGFTLKDIEQMHALLLAYAKECGEIY